jgi:hypothetical protein
MLLGSKGHRNAFPSHAFGWLSGLSLHGRGIQGMAWQAQCLKWAPNRQAGASPGQGGRARHAKAPPPASPRSKPNPSNPIPSSPIPIPMPTPNPPAQPRPRPSTRPLPRRHDLPWPRPARILDGPARPRRIAPMVVPRPPSPRPTPPCGPRPPAGRLGGRGKGHGENYSPAMARPSGGLQDETSPARLARNPRRPCPRDNPPSTGTEARKVDDGKARGRGQGPPRPDKGVPRRKADRKNSRPIRKIRRDVCAFLPPKAPSRERQNAKRSQARKENPETGPRPRGARLIRKAQGLPQEDPSPGTFFQRDPGLC